jgi:RNA polymerase sigma-70 factor (ECF subfamily)
MEKKWSREEWKQAMDAHGSAIEEEAYERLAKYLFRVALNLLNGKYYSGSYLRRHEGRSVEDLAQDFTQCTLLKLFEKYDSFKWESEVTTFATSILAREILNDQRRASTKEMPTSFTEPEDDEDVFPSFMLTNSPDTQDVSPEIDFINQEFQVLVQQAVDQLSNMQRNALIAYVIDGKDVEMVAEEMGISKDLVYKLVSRARQRIRDHISSSDQSFRSR